MKLASFDIFDTTLIRKCGRPENIFAILARRLYPDDHMLREDFLVWRRHVEGRAAQAPPSLKELYANAPFPQYSSEELQQAELSVESDNLIANPEVRQKIEQFRANGFQIAFLSDMYLPGDFLASILVREQCLQPGDSLYISCERNARKDSGELYTLVKDELSPKQWIHFGDNRHSDLRMAERRHIQAHWIDSSFSDSENSFTAAASAYQDPSPASILAGLSRAARIVHGNSPEIILAADFVAPAYIPYVKQLLNLARERGIRRLYFLSRDGWILKQIAEAMHPDLELRELFVSRRALLTPYLHDEFSPEAYLQVLDRHTLKRKNVADLLRQLNLSEQMLSEEYQIRFPYRQIMTQEQETHFLDSLFQSSFTERWHQLIHEQHALAMEYFRQEGLTDGTRSLLIDVGWLGTSRRMIHSMLTAAGYEVPEFAYYGVRSDVIPCCFGRYNSYFREGQLSTECTSLIETYFSQSPNASTIGYRKEADGCRPVWEKELSSSMSAPLKANQLISEWMVQTMQPYSFPDEILYAWAQHAVATLGHLEGRVDLSPLLRMGEFDARDFARKLTVAEILKIMVGGRVTAFDSGSLELSIGRCGRKAVQSVRRKIGSIFYRAYCIHRRLRG